MIEINDLINDPDFAQPFTVRRQVGAFVPGGQGEYAVSDQDIPYFGTIQPASSEDILLYAAEGERSQDWIAIWCAQEIRQGDGQDLLSDIIIWRGNMYRVSKAKHWETQGYYKAWACGFALKEP